MIFSALIHLGRTPTAAPPCGATTPIVIANPDIFPFSLRLTKKTC